MASAPLRAESLRHGAFCLITLLSLTGCALSHRAPADAQVDAGGPWPGCTAPVVLPDLSTDAGQYEYVATVHAACGPDEDSFRLISIPHGRATLVADGSAAEACACSVNCTTRNGDTRCSSDPTYGVPRTCILVRDIRTEGGVCAIECMDDTDCPGDMRCVHPMNPRGDPMASTWGDVDYPSICARVVAPSAMPDAGG